MEEIIRLKVVCVIKIQEKFLFTKRFNQHKQKEFLIPVGGGIKIFEHSSKAVIREVLEETGVTIENPELLGVLEEFFVWRNKKTHEIIFCYFYENDQFIIFPDNGIESNGLELEFRWLDFDELLHQDIQIFPEGLFGLIKKKMCMECRKDN